MPTPDEPIAASITRSCAINGDFRITINFKIELGSTLVSQVLTPDPDGPDEPNGYVLFISNVVDDRYLWVYDFQCSNFNLISQTLLEHDFDPSHVYKVVFYKTGTTISVKLTDVTADEVIGTTSGEDSSFSTFSIFSITGGGATSGTVFHKTYVDDVTVEGN